MTANATRGEISLHLDGAEFILRPSFEAIVAIEADTGCGLVALARQAEDGSMSLQTAALIVMHLIRAQGKAAKDPALEGVNAQRIGQLIMSAEGGLMIVLLRLRLLLTMAVTGGFTPSGEVKAAPVKAMGDNGTTPTAN